MNVLSLLMEYYPYLFHPGIMVGGAMMVLMYIERVWMEGARASLGKRYGTLALVGSLSLLPTLAYMLVTGQGPVETMQGNAWQVDFLVAGGMALVAGVLWYLWRRYEWGRLVPGAMEALVAVTVPYAAFSPFWNVSGHVIFATMPTLYLVLVDRRFWPLLLIPLVMVPNRIYVEAHTWAQSIGGLLIAAGLVVLVFERRRDGSLTVPVGGTRG
jgi:membrane-associated phospholipid phosphatase